jgi:hypothetical protein
MAAPTFEDVDKHIQAADLTAVQPGGKHHPAAGVTGAAALPSICPAYKIVRPILVLVTNTPFIPQKWRDAVKAFIGVLDVICP